jgi:hypothetical protein
MVILFSVPSHGPTKLASIPACSGIGARNDQVYQLIVLLLLYTLIRRYILLR